MSVFLCLCLSSLGAENNVKVDPNTQTISNGVIVPLIHSVNSSTNRSAADVQQVRRGNVPAAKGKWPLCNGVPYDPNVLECCNGVLVPLGRDQGNTAVQTPVKSEAATKTKP